MKTSISSLEISYILKELDILVGGKVDQIYNIREEILFVFHVPNTGKRFLRIVPGKFLFSSNEKESSEEPSNFCMNLRGNLGNARLRQITQKIPERIVEFVFEKESRRKVYTELFSHGNIVLCDENDRIITAQIMRTWKDRSILSKEVYNYPKSIYNIFDLSLNDLKEGLSTSKKDKLVTCLAIDLCLGGIYSEEVCLIAGIDKHVLPKEINEEQAKKILKAIKSLLDKKTEAMIIFENSHPLEATPFLLESFKGFEKKSFLTYNQALNEYYIGYYSKLKAEKSPYEKEIEKLRILVNTQENKIKELKSKIEDESEKAEMIYNNYNVLREITDEIRKASSKYSWHEIKERLKGHKIVKEINPEEKSIVVELE